MNLPIMPGFPQLKKSLKNLQVSIPKAVREHLKIDELEGTYESFLKENKFADAIHSFGKWLETVIPELDRMDDELFEPKKGRNVENEKVTLFGKEQLVPIHAMDLLKGSKLATYLKDGLPEGYGAGEDIKTVLNLIRSSVDKLIPEDARKKRETVKPENVSEDATEENSETAE